MAYNRSEMRAARVRRDLSQIDMAGMLGITSQAYWRKENGKNVFSLKDLDILREKMQLTDEELHNIFFA